MQENIITMVQDDLAKNFMNPHPGKVYNRPGGPNVYKDVPLVGPLSKVLPHPIMPLLPLCKAIRLTSALHCRTTQEQQ